tara:strand:+ start:304 stop:555 length:252 start_codon:yes stop_codon:yes gene_type:complete
MFKGIKERNNCCPPLPPQTIIHSTNAFQNKPIRQSQEAYHWLNQKRQDLQGCESRRPYVLNLSDGQKKTMGKYSITVCVLVKA